MKKVILFVSIIAFMSSCSFLNESELEEIDDLTVALEQDVIGTLSIGEIIYLFNQNEDETITKFVNRKKKYEFKYDKSSLNLKDSEANIYLRSNNYNFRFENRLTGEVIEMINIETVSDKRLTFDILTSEGILLENFILDAEILGTEVENARVECWQCIIIPAIKLVEAILDTFSDNIDSNCAKAIESCGEEGPKSVEITEGWFSSSCKVECK